LEIYGHEDALTSEILKRRMFFTSKNYDLELFGEGGGYWAREVAED